MRRAAWIALALLACSDPPPPSSSIPPSIATEDGVRVHVGGREVVVHCALTCAATETELTRLSGECVANPASGPHHVTAGGALLTIGCCEEAALAYDRGCGHEGLPGCAQGWTARCQGVQPRDRAIPDGDRGVSSERGASR